MSDLKLVIGDKNRSATSLRAWLVLKQLDLAFGEILIPLDRTDTPERILRYSPSGTLPLLMAGEIRVWDALAIAEFLADHFTTLWPHGVEARATARSVCGELHGGFRELDTFLPMDIAHRYAAPARLLTHVARAVRRVTDIWNECRTRHGANGPFLFGEFTIADAMFAPVCTQFTTHSLPLDDLSRAYVNHMLALPRMQEWAAGAIAEIGGRSSASEEKPETEEPQADAPPPPTPAAPVAEAPPLASEPALEEDEGTRDAEAAPPAPGLPGVVPTRPYTPEPEPEPAAPRLRGSLFRWRSPAGAFGEVPAPVDEDEEPVAPSRLRRPPPLAPSPSLEAEPPAEPEAEEPPPPRFFPRPETIKPIGDGTRRRR
jgi:glutathione S-transferase